MTPMGTDRREYIRAELIAPLVCTLSHEGAAYPCVVRNISLHGIRVECPPMHFPDAIEPTERVRLTPLHDTTPLVWPEPLLLTVKWTYLRHIGLHVSTPMAADEQTLLATLYTARLLEHIPGQGQGPESP